MNQNSPFKLAMPIRKSYTEVDSYGESHYFIYGLASGVNVDKVNDRMAESAITAFKDAIDRGKLIEIGPDQFAKSQLPLRSEHQNYWDSDLGWLVEAEVDMDKNLWIKAELDQDNPRAMGLFKRLSKGDSPGRPRQLGLSVGGFINKVRNEYDTLLKRQIRVIEEVELEEISVTSQPANPATMVAVMRKSLNDFPEESDTMGKIEDKIRSEIGEEQSLAKNEESENTDLTNQEDASNLSESTEETEKVTPSESAGDGVVEKSMSEEDETDLRKMIESLSETVAQLSKSVEGLTKAETEQVTPSEEVVQKSETEEVTPNVEELTKSVETNIESRLVSALSTAFESFKKDYVDTLSEKMDLIKTDVERIAATPVDRSFAMQQDKTGENLSPLQRFEKKFEEEGRKTTFNPILESVRASWDSTVEKLG